MAHSRRTLKLDPLGWDVESDGAGRITLAQGAAATAQNVANESRLFTNDAYFNQDRGIPYYLAALGQKANLTMLRSYLRKAALTVGDVREVKGVELSAADQQVRELSGTIQFTTVGDSNDDPISTDF